VDRPAVVNFEFCVRAAASRERPSIVIFLTKSILSINFVLRSQYGVVGVFANRASIPSSQFDIALISPLDTPRILDLPVVNRHAGHQHPVIDSFAATVSKNAGFVEGPVESIHGHCHWLLQQGPVETLASDLIPVGFYLELSLVLAVLVLADVGVDVLCGGAPFC
jgi:hypothetical protein